MKRETTYWERIFAKDTPDIEVISKAYMISKIYRALLKFNNKKSEDPVKK